MTHARRLVVLSLALGTWLMIANDAAAGRRNISQSGTGIIGVAEFDDNTHGTSYAHFSHPERVNDGIITTREDNHTYAAPSHMWTWEYDWVGISFASPVDIIDTVRVSNATFGDGGWWGPYGAGPTPAVKLTTADLVAPKVQVTADGGTTWSDLPDVVDDYVDTWIDHPLTHDPKLFATFTFPAQSGIDGIRLFGPGGGIAGGRDLPGFIGVFEFEVWQLPEPSTFVLATLGLPALFVRRRRKRAA